MDLPEGIRLIEDAGRTKNWKRWGPYLSERQWGTVREDYSPDGSCWEYFPHEHARSRAYRWGEDGLLGISDREGRLCFSLALWNGRDPILKERLFGLTGPEGNHGEDVKEHYFYLDATPTHSYMKALYKYPQAEFPYAHLVEENRRREGRPGIRAVDTGVFDGEAISTSSPSTPRHRRTTSSSGSPWPTAARRRRRSMCCRRSGFATPGPGAARGRVLAKPRIRKPARSLLAEHASLGRFRLAADAVPMAMRPSSCSPKTRRTPRDCSARPTVRPTSRTRSTNTSSRAEARGQPGGTGTKAGAQYGWRSPRRRNRGAPAPVLGRRAPAQPFGDEFDGSSRSGFARPTTTIRPPPGEPDRRGAPDRAAGLRGPAVVEAVLPLRRQGLARGRPRHPPPPASRRHGRNRDWHHLFNRDVLSMPDKWEYPWYAAWDLAFHMIPLREVDPHFAKEQLAALPARVVHASQRPDSRLRIRLLATSIRRSMPGPLARLQDDRTARRRDRIFLARRLPEAAAQLHLVGEPQGRRRQATSSPAAFSAWTTSGCSIVRKPLPAGGHLEQADGTAWMAFYCATMLAMALELAAEDPAYEDMATKFFEHFVAIADAMNTHRRDRAVGRGRRLLLRSSARRRAIHPASRPVAGGPDAADRGRDARRTSRSTGCRVPQADATGSSRTGRTWPGTVTCDGATGDGAGPAASSAGDSVAAAARAGAALPARRERVPLPVRHPLACRGSTRTVRTCSGSAGKEHRVTTCRANRTTGMFGGNSNWRGPIWFPVNYLLVEALERYHHFYGETLRVECPTGSGRWMDLASVAPELQDAWRGSFSPVRAARVLPRPACRRSQRTRTGATCCCSTNTSTATPAAGSARAIRRAGPRWSSGASEKREGERRGNFFRCGL